VVGDKFEESRIDAKTADQVAMDEVQVAVSIAGSLQDLESGASEGARPRHVDLSALVPYQHLLVVSVDHLGDMTTSF